MVMRRFLKYGPVLIVIAAVLWGLDGILRRSLFTLPPIIIVFYEHLIGLIIIAPFLIKRWKQEKLTKNEWWAVGFVSLLSGVLGTLWFTTALAKVHFIPFSVVFLIQKLQPIFAIAASAILLRERITRKYAVWAVVALVSAYFVTFKNGIVNFGEGGAVIIAALFALGAAFAWGTSTAFSRFTLVRHSHTFITGLRFLITVPLAFILLLFMGKASMLNDLTSSNITRLIIIALTTGMVALWIYYRGLALTQAKIATILELVFPLTAVIIDIFLYKTFLAPTQYIAALVLLFAVYKVSRLNSQEANVPLAG